MLNSIGHSSRKSDNGPIADPSLLWLALAEDTNCFVLIVDVCGVCHFANESVSRTFAPDSGGMVGKTVYDVFPRPVAVEKLGFLQQAAQSDEPLAVEGMCNGCLERTTYRRLPKVDGEAARVLVVVTPASATRPFSPATEGHPVVRASKHDLGPLACLTERELQILRLIGLGHSTATIAKELHRSVKTIEWHRVALGDKLGVTNRVELARIAIAAGLPSLDDFETRALAVSKRSAGHAA